MKTSTIRAYHASDVDIRYNLDKSVCTGDDENTTFIDRKTSWFAYEDAIDDWNTIELDDKKKRRLALRNRLKRRRHLQEDAG